MDRSDPTKLRRTVPKLSPLSRCRFWTRSRGCLKWARIWTYIYIYIYTDALGASEGMHVSNDHSSDAQHDGPPREPPPRLVVCPKVWRRVRACRGLSRACLLPFYISKAFLLPFLLRPVSQLCRGAEDALGSCRGANSAT